MTVAHFYDVESGRKDLGVPPYGYVGEKIPHPVPARRAEGRTKTRLLPDPVRAPVVLQIYHWR